MSQTTPSSVVETFRRNHEAAAWVLDYRLRNGATPEELLGIIARCADDLSGWDVLHDLARAYLMALDPAFATRERAKAGLPDPRRQFAALNGVEIAIATRNADRMRDAADGLARVLPAPTSSAHPAEVYRENAERLTTAILNLVTLCPWRMAEPDAWEGLQALYRAAAWALQCWHESEAAP